jgi:hypothetical protein
MTEIKSENQISIISSKVKTDGYYLSVNELQQDEFSVLILAYYVDVYIFDKENKKIPIIIGTSDEQDPWTNLLNFKYKANEEDTLIDWDHSNLHFSATTTGYIRIYLYYKELKEYPIGNFKIIDLDGMVGDWSNINGIVKVVETGEIIKDEIKNLDVFIKTDHLFPII